MGYDIHITRRAHWADDGSETIAPEEWLSVLDSDPELSRADDGGPDAIAGAWNGETLFWYWFRTGEVTCKNPDKAMIRKMVQIADCLGANVQGDDGERYPEALGPSKPVAKPSLWRRLFGGG